MDTLLQNLMDILKAISPFLWETLLRQVHVEARTNIFFSCLAFFVSIPFAYYFLRNNKERKEFDPNSPPRENAESMMVLTGFLFAVAWTILLSCAVDAVQTLSNPDYYAIMKIIESIR